MFMTSAPLGVLQRSRRFLRVRLGAYRCGSSGGALCLALPPLDTFGDYEFYYLGIVLGLFIGLLLGFGWGYERGRRA